MELWNQKDLVPPALATFKCKSKSCKAEIRALVSSLSEAIQYYESLSSSFDQAAAYISRFTTRWNDRFYNMHGFRLLKRLNQAMVRLRSVDIVRALGNVFSILPDGNYLEPVVELPTRGNLEYLLVRLQGVSKLFCRIVVLAKEAARYYVRFMSSGYFFNLSTMFLCLQAEIWYKSREICQRTVQFYDKLITLRSFLEQPGASRWPSKDGICLPEELGTWLGEDWTNEIIAQDDPSKELNLQSGTNLFVLLTGEPADLSTAQKVDKQIISKVSSEEQVVKSIPKALLMQRISAATDLGEVVSRKAFPPKTPTIKSRKSDGLEAIRAKFDVKQFLDEEKRKRREDPMQALSRDVMAGQFGVFVAGISRDMNRLPTKEFVQEFKQGWKKIIAAGKDKAKQKK